MNVSLLIVPLVITSLVWAKHPLNKLVDDCIREGIRDIRKSMGPLIRDKPGVEANGDVRLQSRSILLDMLITIKGIDHYEIYKSFVEALGEARWRHYSDNFYVIFYTNPFVESAEITGRIPSSVLDTYRLLVWSANLERENDAALFEIVKLANEFIREVSKLKWESGSAQAKFIAATKNNMQILTKIMTELVSLSSILNMKVEFDSKHKS